MANFQEPEVAIWGAFKMLTESFGSLVGAVISTVNSDSVSES